MAKKRAKKRAPAKKKRPVWKVGVTKTKIRKIGGKRRQVRITKLRAKPPKYRVRMLKAKGRRKKK